MTRLPFRIQMPETRDTAVVFASPHSGSEYPWDFIRESRLDEVTIRSSEDAFVDRLYSAAPDFGAPLLSTDVPRAYVDLNRSAEELDPALISGVRQTGHNPRISSGLGVIPRVVANGREIRSGKISAREAQERLSLFYHPYHAKLSELLQEARAAHGFSLLFDCHSMPSDALLGMTFPNGIRPEIVLGDRFGVSCAPAIIEAAEAAFVAEGFRVSRNLPFAGAFVAQQYGRPSSAQHCVQIEIDRSIYMNEGDLTPRDDFDLVQARLSKVIQRLTELGRTEELREAAE